MLRRIGGKALTHISIQVAVGRNTPVGCWEADRGPDQLSGFLSPLEAFGLFLSLLSIFSVAQRGRSAHLVNLSYFCYFFYAQNHNKDEGRGKKQRTKRGSVRFLNKQRKKTNTKGIKQDARDTAPVNLGI